jgi:transcriptional antiterminator RfaH
VVITQGPFAGLEAIYQLSDGESRVMVLLNILSKTVKMYLAPTGLRKMN